MSDPPAALHVVLVAPEIPWNTGNAGRTCLAAGAHLHLIRPLGFSVDEHAVKRAGVHHWRDIRPTVWDRWEAFEAALPGLGEPFYFSATAAKDLREARFPARAVLVFGNESRGLPEEIRLRNPGRTYAIPMREKPGISLNLSTAVGIALYEVLRQRPRAAPPTA